MSPPGDDAVPQSSIQSSSEQSSIASTLLVPPLDEDTEIQSSTQSSEEGNQSVASRTRLQLACQRTTTNAFQTETDANNPPPTSQFTNDNPLTDLQDRQRAPLKQLRRCFENHTRNESPTSGTPDEEVDYGSFDIVGNSST